MAKRSAAVLSDIHIGIDHPTNWYQTTAHEERLVALLDWVADNAGDIRELILLGDLVDIWTYPPDMLPPTMAEIIAANPKTLGPEGALKRAVDALPGQVTFLLGNHNGQITQQDLADLYASVGPLNFVEGGVYTLTGDSGAATTFAHGHHGTMFNAPDPNSPWGTMPIGHFVTRAFSHYLMKILPPGQTAADLPNMGSPNGFNLEKLLKSLSPDDDSVADALLNYTLQQSGMKKDTKIVLPGGEEVRYSEAYGAYRDLFTDWVEKNGDSRTIALRAACADQWGVYLGWFAQRLAIQHTSDLVIFGHTHQPVPGIAPSPVNAINSGFECVPLPDDPPKQCTFTMVDLETASGQIRYLPPDGGAPVPFPAGRPQTPVERLPMMPPKADCSCYVTVVNTTGATLTRDALPEPAYGMWIVPPPEEIAPGATAMAWLEDDYDLIGSKGSFSYNNGGLAFTFSCAVDWPNSITGPNDNFVARAGTSGWGPVGLVPEWGHPLQIRYTV